MRDARLAWAFVTVAATAIATAATEVPSLNLFDWMNPAPTVLAGRVIGEDGKYTEVAVTRVFRGQVRPEDVVQIRVHKVNRERKEFQRPLRLDVGRAYTFLLKDGPVKKKTGQPTYDLVRGVYGVREVPPEGAPAFFAALQRFAAVQSTRDDAALWPALRVMLEETNPILLETSLEQFLKFRRGDPQMVPLLRPLMDHPSPVLRRQTLQLLGLILERSADGEVPDREGLLGEIVAHARRDSETEVRVAATEALGGVRTPGIEKVLEQISREDPDQTVRYVAERLLFERRDGNEPAENPASISGASSR